ncbi:MAG: hypothetical protein KDE35_17910 [Geminicoccaceae bacterium]|nr:hypothetical protein [Geminicoccaceae bacterium]
MWPDTSLDEIAEAVRRYARPVVADPVEVVASWTAAALLALPLIFSGPLC